MTQVSDWGKYSDLLYQLGSMSLDWSSWANLTAGIRLSNPGLWGAVPENAFFGKGLAELVGEIYGVAPTDVDLDDAAQLKTTDTQVLTKLWHIVNSRPATDLDGWGETWAGYFVCWESDGSMTYAAARDADDWEPVYAAEDTEPEYTEPEQTVAATEEYAVGSAYAPEPTFTPWGDYWIKDEGVERWFGANYPDGPWYRTPQEFEATLWPPAPDDASARAVVAADQVDAMLDTLFSGDFYDELGRRLEAAGLSPERAKTAMAKLNPQDFGSIVAEAFTTGA